MGVMKVFIASEEKHAENNHLRMDCLILYPLFLQLLK